MPRRPPPASWLVDWVKQSIAHAKDLMNRDPQKLLERICQVSFAANAVIQVRCADPRLFTTGHMNIAPVSLRVS